MDERLGGLGEYTLLRRLGEGGMGEVFAARHDVSGELVALKRLVGIRPTHLYRFKREFRAMADDAHPNLVRLGELVIEAEGSVYFTMERVEGRPFDEWVRRRTPANQLPNPVRLLRAYRQLVAGVAHLHARGHAHRDLKPSNVLVTREGRVVILDFGLPAEQTEDPDSRITREGEVLGTPAYMAPEQGLGAGVGSAVDLYTLGVMLFRCLTGRLPFEGPSFEVLVTKQTTAPPDPRALVPDTPPELAALCVELLAIDPRARPSCVDVLARLSTSAGSERAARAPERTPSKRFVGRDAELGRLEAALLEVLAGRPRTVFVRGPSGIGKSALVANFVTRAIDEHDALVLRGRCLERESVPFKGVDALVDALSAHLRRMSDLEVATYEPRHAAPLVTIFPVLADLWRVRKRRDAGPHDLQHQRRLGLAALREIVGRLADDRLVVFHLEDFQWADLDGARLLTELARPPDPPNLLLIVSFRDEIAARECLRELSSQAALAGRVIDDIVLGPLADHDAATLARALVHPSAPAGEQALAQTIERAGGSPFYLHQLLHADLPGDLADTSSLDAVVARRYLLLDSRRRRVLAIVAVAGGPIRESLVLALEPDREAIGDLVELGLVFGDGDEPDPLLDTTHDRIREVVLGELDLAELRRWNLELAHLLAAREGPPERLAELFERGGEPELALEQVERAAEQAAATLGFARASELLRRALRLLGEREPDRRARLEAAIAEQQVNLGRAREAAELFLGLVERAAHPTLALTHRRQAADNLIKSGQIERGLDVLEAALAEFGHRLARRPWLAIASLGVHRLRLAWRGSSYTLRRADELDPRTREHLATLLAGTLGLMAQEMLMTTALHARLLRVALDAGEPYHLACAHLWEMILWLNAGFDGRARRWRGEIRAIATNTDDPMVQGIAVTGEAAYTFLSRSWQTADADWERVLVVIEDIPQLGWLRSMRTFVAYCKLALGSIAALRALLPEWIDDARGIDSQKDVAELLGFSSVVEVYVGDLGDARAQLEQARAHWRVPRYTFPEFFLDSAEIPLRLACGELAQAAETIARSLASARRWQVHRMVMAREDLLDLHARSFASLAIETRDDRAARLARASARKLARDAHPASRARAAIIDAALAERPDRAHAAWLRAYAEFGRADMRAHRAATGLRLAALGRHEQVAELRASGEAYFAGEGVRDLERALRVLVPAPAWLAR